MAQIRQNGTPGPAANAVLASRRQVSRQCRPVYRKLASLLFLSVWVLTAGAAFAAPRDKAAQKKIEEAIYTNFLNTDFDAAEGLLLGTIRACEDKCSPALVAKAWMYVGVVRGSGRNDMAGATEAFGTALQTDPNVALDNEIATDPVKAVFAKVKGGAGKPPPAQSSGGGGGAEFTCKPAPTEIETRRPVPLQCETDKDITGAKLHYKSFSGQWETVVMEQDQGNWRGTIPCKVTQNTGKLKFYVEGKDGDEVAVTFGSKDKPKTADVVSETSADPPAFPEEEAPARCGLDESAAEAPPPSSEGGECKAYGAACSGNCCEGLACINGTCGEPECQSDSDCSNGAECQSGKCEGGDEKGGSDNYAKNLVGLSFAMDLASISATEACAKESRKDNIACFFGDNSTLSRATVKGSGGKIGGGFTLATMRVLASYERLFGAFGVEGKLGFAFNGGPTPKGGTAFLPVHAELRLKYWVLGTKAFTKPGFRPWVHLGGGLAQVDASVMVPVRICQETAQACLDGTAAGPYDQKSLKAVKQLGQSFVGLGGGVMYAVGKTHGAVLGVNFMIPFPSSGFVIEPSLGYTIGF